MQCEKEVRVTGLKNTIVTRRITENILGVWENQTECYICNLELSSFEMKQNKTGCGTSLVFKCNVE